MPRGKKFEFTQEQKNYIVNNWGKESAYSMKTKFGCSWEAVCNVAKEFGLDMPESEKWTKDQVNDLIKMSDKMHYEEIAKKLGKTNNAVYLKAKKLGVTRDRICTTWVDLGLKLRKHKISNKKSYYCIKIENLIEFLKDNQDQWDSRNLELYILGDEPEWLSQKRKRDIEENPLWYRFWSVEEKNKAVMLLKMGKSYKEIADQLDRTEQAVMYMLRDEGYGYRLKQFWKGQELKFLKDNFKVMKYSDIADSLGRTTKAVAAKAEEMGYRKK